MKTILLLYVLLITPPWIYSQEDWILNYNGTGNNSDVAKDMAIDKQGNVYVTGYCYNAGTFNDFVSIKYSSDGNQQWIATFNGPGNDNDYSAVLTIDASGNLYVTGQSFKASSSYDYATVKYNPSGDIEWSAAYNGSGNGIDFTKGIVVDDLGNVYVTGQSYGGIGTSYDFATIKYNSSGAVQWIARYNGPGNGNDGGNAITVDQNYNVIVTGQSTGHGSMDYATIKYDPSGNEIWVARYDGPVNDIDISHCILSDNSGNIYVAGYSRGNNTLYDYASIKYDANGNEIWMRRYNGPFNKSDIPSAMKTDTSGNIFITGIANYDFSGIYSNYATVKYSSDGTLQWVATFNGAANNIDSATSISLDETGNIYVTGKSIGFGTSYDYATVKYNSSGVQQSMSRYNGTANSNDISNAVDLDNSGNIYITGASMTPNSGYDYLTIKYSSLAGVHTINNIVPSEYSLSQNFPNPFNPVTYIEFGISKSALINLKVYDQIGKNVATVVNEMKSAGNYRVKFDASNLCSGIYFYKLEVDGENIDTKKMMLVK